MDAIDTITNDAGKFLSGNTTYAHYKEYWTFLFESYIGGEEYRNAGNLTHYVNESSGEYRARIDNTPLQNHCASVISVYNSFLFRNTPTRTFGSIEGLAELEDFIYDADMDGRSFNAFMKDVATYASIFGHTWVICVKPNVGATTRGDEMAQGVRPYVNMMSPLTVLDWSWERQTNGRYSLDYLKYIEDVNGDITTVKEWTKDIIRTTVIDEDKGVIQTTTIEENGLGKIPAILAYNKRSIIRGIGISDIADIADAQKFIYNATSEIDQSIRLDSHPSLVKTPETTAGVGAGAIIHMPDNLDPGLKPYVLDFQGASVEKILETIAQTVDSIDKMANTGAVRATQSRTLSGVAMETEFSLLSARLSEKGDALELAEEQIWTYWAEYMGYTWDGKVEYPDSFNLRDSRNDLEMYMKALEAPVNSKEYKKEIYKQIAKTVIDDELALDTILNQIQTMPVEIQMIGDQPIAPVDMPTGETLPRPTSSTPREIQVLDYQTEYHYMCPSAVLFAQKMIREGRENQTLLQIVQMSDRVFDIEADVEESGMVTQTQIDEARNLVDEIKKLAIELTGSSELVGYMELHYDAIVDPTLAGYLKAGSNG